MHFEITNEKNNVFFVMKKIQHFTLVWDFLFKNLFRLLRSLRPLRPYQGHRGGVSKERKIEMRKKSRRLEEETWVMKLLPSVFFFLGGFMIFLLFGRIFVDVMVFVGNELQEVVCRRPKTPRGSEKSCWKQ